MASKHIAVSGGFFLCLAAMLLVLPLPWVAAIFVAACIHEAGHYVAIRLFAGRGAMVRLYSFAVHMPLPQMSRWKEFLCALAGPVAGLSLLLLARWMPRTAICALGQSVYNLMPIYPLDGGRALRCLFSMTMPPPKVEKITKIVETVCRITIIFLAVYAAFRFDLGILPLIAVSVMLFRTK